MVITLLRCALLIQLIFAGPLSPILTTYVLPLCAWKLIGDKNVTRGTFMFATVTTASIVHSHVIPETWLSLKIVSVVWIGAKGSVSPGCISVFFCFLTAFVFHSHHFSPGRESEYMDRLSDPSNSVCTLSGRLPPTASYLIARES